MLPPSEELAIRTDDNWLVMALKEARQKEKNDAVINSLCVAVGFFLAMENPVWAQTIDEVKKAQDAAAQQKDIADIARRKAMAKDREKLAQLLKEESLENFAQLQGPSRTTPTFVPFAESKLHEAEAEPQSASAFAGERRRWLPSSWKSHMPKLFRGRSRCKASKRPKHFAIPSKPYLLRNLGQQNRQRQK